MALVFAQPRFFVVFSYWQKFGIKSRFCPKRHFLSRFCQVLRCIFIFLHHPLLILNFSQGNEIYRNKVYLVYKYVCDSLWRWRSWLWGRLFVRIIIENVTNRKQNGRIALHELCTCRICRRNRFLYLTALLFNFLKCIPTRNHFFWRGTRGENCTRYIYIYDFFYKRHRDEGREGSRRADLPLVLVYFGKYQTKQTDGSCGIRLANGVRGHTKHALLGIWRNETLREQFKDLQSTARAHGGVSEEIGSNLDMLRELQRDVTTAERPGVCCLLSVFE